VDFVEISNVYIGKMIIKAAKRIFNSDKICRSYSDLNFGVTFLEHSVLVKKFFLPMSAWCSLRPWTERRKARLSVTPRTSCSVDQHVCVCVHCAASWRQKYTHITIAAINQAKLLCCRPY